MHKPIIKISGIINTYNEASNIVGCVKSISWIDEIIVVDMGSSDNTIEFAKSFTNKIFTFPYSEYVESARNFALSKASNQWVLILDADERLPFNSEGIIRKLILNKQIDGYMFPRRNYVNSKTYLKHGYFYPDYQLRLFRNKSEIKYTGVIHAQAQINPKKVRRVNNLEIYHNYSHSKYNSFSSFSRFINYIKIEGRNKAKSDVKDFQLLIEIIIEFLRNFWRSFIKLRGYKDYYYGFRAAILYSLYKASIPLYSLLIRKRLDPKI